MNNRFSFLIAVIAALCLSIPAQAQTKYRESKKYSGAQFGTAAGQKIGFFGTAPVVQPANTNTSREALVALGLLADGGADPTDYVSAVADGSLTDGVDIAVGTSTGTKLATATAQKLGFHNATPVIQRAGADQAVIGSQTGYVAVASLKALVVTGVASPGAATATGLAVDDVVVSVVNLTDSSQATTSFESTVTVADQIQQSSASDLSTKKFLVLVGKNSATDIAALKTLVNELRAALVEKGLIKGAP